MMKLSLMIFCTLLLKKLKFLSYFIHNWLMIMIIFILIQFNTHSFYTTIYFNYSFDFLSINLIILTLWILPLSILSNFIFMKNQFNMKFLVLIIMMTLFLILCFLTTNMFMFYFFFESTLIPIMLLIMGWGNQIDRIQASMYMLFYTLCGSLPLLIMLILIYNKYYSLNMLLLTMNFLTFKNFNNYVFLCLTTVFFVKMPIYFYHSWLPKAHVESPISGSMILAGIMLKLGSYGLLRFMLIFPVIFLNPHLIWIIIALLGSIFATLICMNLNDLKMIIAYSSITHMGMLMASMLTMYNWGYTGGMIMMISHGLNSSVLFCLVNFYYERIHSRNLILIKGKINFLPHMSLWWFLICISNMSAPPSLNFFSEILLITSILLYSKIFLIFLPPMILLNSLFNIFLFSHTQNTKFNTSNLNFHMFTIREFMIIIFHYYPLIFMFIYMYLFI